MPDNRPKGREKHVSGQGKDVYRRGEGLGTGPVGSGSNPTPQQQGQAPRGYDERPVTRSGGRSPLLILILIAVLLLGGGGGLGNLLGMFTGDTSVQPQAPSQNNPSAYDSLLPSTQTPSGSSTGANASLGSLLMGGGNSWVGTNAVNSWSGNANTGVLNREVSPEARDKFTQIVGRGQDEVTVMVYICGTDLESRSAMASRDLMEMGKATLSDKLNLLVCTGGCKQWRTNGIRNDINQIFQIEDGYLKNTGKTLGSGSMTDPNTMLGFINYCTENYPANRYMLILWDHGGGSISGYGYDETHAKSGSMNLATLSNVLRSSGVKYDFIGFDACLMATVENASMLSEYADYLIASEETEPGIGWYYTNWLTKLAADTSMPTLDIGKQIVDDFIAACNQQCPGQPTTLSVVDLSELGETLPDEMKAFSENLTSMITGGNYQAVSTARGNSKEFAASTRIDQIDFVDFAERIGSEESRALSSVLRSAVKYNRCSGGVSSAYGLSVYFPLKKMSTVDQAVKTYDALGMDESYTACIRAFASLEASGQISTGGISGSNPYASLLGNYSSGYSSGASSMADISSLLNAAMGGDLGSLLGMVGTEFLGGRSLEDNQAAAEYLAENRFDPSQLFWQRNIDGDEVICMDESQWALVQDLALNMFLDDGTGYMDLGLDNLFSFDDNGNLLPDTEGTWLSLNGQPVAYYYIGTDTDENGETTISGYVPALLNGERVRLMLLFTSEHPEGYVAGAQPAYEAEDTETVSRGLFELEVGDRIDFLCDYYSYAGEYQDSYMLGDPMTYDGTLTVSDTYVNGRLRVLYRFTDIYDQQYWSEALHVE